MNEISYTTQDKSTWGDGPWHDEPDKIQWQDEATGLPCLMVRNHWGAWCGYVGVSEGHPAFELDYDEADELSERVNDGYLQVHGGLTYANHCVEGPEDVAICHVPAPGEPDHVWWLGFDTAHAFDYVPGMRAWERNHEEPKIRALAEERAIYDHETALSAGQPFYAEVYRDQPYVKAEVESLAKQLHALVASESSELPIERHEQAE